MLDSDQLRLLYERLKLSESARAIVDHIRSSEPSRRVASRVGNVTGVYPSQQMKVGIQYESRTVERPFLVQFEYDSNVKEFYEQPPAIPLSYIARNGRRVSIKHTPDVFVIYEDRIEWQEFKPASVMPELAEKMPNRYVQNDDGTWRCPPGQDYASSFGKRKIAHTFQ